jgi:putative nucleotidyltransferase with HDIG domain
MNPTPHTTEIPAELTRELPPMPVVATRLFEMAGNPETDATDMARVLSVDAALTAKVLRTANSSYYATTTPITNVLQAVTRMGFRALRNLVLVESLPFRSRGAQGPDPVAQGLWEHSVATALGARLLARHRGGCHPDDAFVHGLLHDIGKGGMARHRPDDYATVLEDVGDGSSFAEAERDAFGFDHAEAGAAILSYWKLPGSVVEGVRLHHRTGEGEAAAAWAAVDLASRAAKALQLGLEKRPDLVVEDCEAGRLLGFAAEEAAGLKVELAAAFEAEKAVFQL